MKFVFLNETKGTMPRMMPLLLLVLATNDPRRSVTAFSPAWITTLSQRRPLVTSFTSPLAVTSAAEEGTTRSSTKNSPVTTNTNSDSTFSAFAESLDEDSLFDDDDYDSGEGYDVSNEYSTTTPTWQESLESLLDPTTPLAKRQIVLTDLLNSNEKIRESVLAALRERKIDPLLTPTGKKLQDGTRAVARQLTNDILPGLAAAVRSGPTSSRGRGGGSSGNMSSSSPSVIVEDLPSLVPKLGSRIFDAISSQARKNLEQLRDDLADPSRIPRRISKQTADLAAEARNVFLETPEGLDGPKYRVVTRRAGYEIREYEGYTVASTSIADVGERFSMDDVAGSGAAFNALAAYLFGANVEGKAMEMTTPVATTSSGEMRFYLRKDGMTTDPFPNPLTEKDDGFNERGNVQLIDVPPARLAVARFTGFVTEGEVARQKDALLTALAVDGVEIDVPHGAVVPHVVFQYNPPYTLPIVRRNEIAVPVRKPGSAGAADLETEWGGEDLSPSDVEQADD